MQTRRKFIIAKLSALVMSWSTRLPFKLGDLSSNIEAVQPPFLGRRGAGIIKNSGRRIIIYARGGASLYMQVIKGVAQVRVRSDVTRAGSGK